MPEVQLYPPGSFCWAELVTSEADAARQFYSKVFGWHPNDQPMGPDQYYTMLELRGGKSVAALFGRDPQQIDRSK